MLILLLGWCFDCVCLWLRVDLVYFAGLFGVCDFGFGFVLLAFGLWVCICNCLLDLIWLLGYLFYDCCDCFVCLSLWVYG